MRPGRPRFRIGRKYCGSCNPQVDLPRVAAHLARVAASHGFEVVLTASGETDFDILVLLCGCRRACATKTEVARKSARNLVVAGGTLKGQPIAEADLPAAVEAEVVGMAGGANRGGSQRSA